jgi:hypothetical protein
LQLNACERGSEAMVQAAAEGHVPGGVSRCRSTRSG